MHAIEQTGRQTGFCAALGYTLASVVVAALTLVSLSLPARSASGAAAAYTIGNYPVEASADNAVTAKATAIAQGQQAALRSLFRRLVPVTAYKRLKAMPPMKAADFIEGVAVRRERNSPTDYLATLDFSFDQASVRSALSRAGIPFVDEQSAPVMLIPLWRDHAQAPIQSGKGPWFDAWASLDLVHTLTPLRLEGLKPNLTFEALQPILEGRATTGRILAPGYRTESIVLALAEPDASGNKLHVTIAGQDLVGPLSFKRTYRITGGDRAYTSELAAVIGLGVLEGRWKAAKAGAVGGVDVTEGAGAIRLVVEFASLAEWNDMRARILDADGAFDIDVGSVSPRSAEVAVRHAGGPDGLNEAFARNGLAMSQQAGAWRVRATF